MGNGEWGMGNGEWGMGNGEWGMGNGELKWEGKVVRVLLELAQLDFFGDGLM